MALSGWTDYPLNISDVNWSYRGRNLRLSGEFGTVSWKMPRGFSPETIHQDLLFVASEVLLSPFVKGLSLIHI